MIDVDSKGSNTLVKYLLDIGYLPNVGLLKNVGNLPNEGYLTNVGYLPNVRYLPNVGCLPNVGLHSKLVIIKNELSDNQFELYYICQIHIDFMYLGEKTKPILK